MGDSLLPPPQLPSAPVDGRIAYMAVDLSTAQQHANSFDESILVFLTASTASLWALILFLHVSRWVVEDLQKLDIRVALYFPVLSALNLVKVATNFERQWLLAIRGFFECYVLFLLFYVAPVTWLGGELRTASVLELKHGVRDRSFLSRQKTFFLILLCTSPSLHIFHAILKHTAGDIGWLDDLVFFLSLLIVILALVLSFSFWRRVQRECRILRLSVKQAYVVPLIIVGAVQEQLMEALWGSSENGMRFSGALIVCEVAFLMALVCWDFSVRQEPAYLLISPDKQTPLLHRVGTSLCFWDVFFPGALPSPFARFHEMRDALEADKDAKFSLYFKRFHQPGRPLRQGQYAAGAATYPSAAERGLEGEGVDTDGERGVEAPGEAFMSGHSSPPFAHPASSSAAGAAGGLEAAGDGDEGGDSGDSSIEESPHGRG
uniref:Transmembrane protein n=1 Tax=Chromera velia CCMP2878 TaxID=1169474 RepID=A0A0G4HE58_9ALVE|eukprot:Cvel_26641.t1-p1 / transcript=Cvel_26641.t1 / gene=Cvel_26641 / organism=Chromera_velia_CCMP2878 / gene_product=hypothetical protein / transcript_product=hypothetical protein / location=Cvel_scaffold3203:12509-16737(+) / protein_length=432 / sequence_SO=supercontig / SO=protein_coding / is_pseudo=false